MTQSSYCLFDKNKKRKTISNCNKTKVQHGTDNEIGEISIKKTIPQ
jgi:hypothetical protein